MVNQQWPELLLRQLSNIGVFLIAPDYRISTWSPGVEQILGYSQDDFIGQDSRMLFTPEDRAAKQDEAEFARARSTGVAPDVRWHMKKDGRRVFVEGSLCAISNQGDERPGYLKIMRDIGTDRVTEGMLRAILDRTSDVIYIRDKHGRYTFANSEMARLVGRSIDDVIGHSYEEFWPAHVTEQLREHDTKIIVSDTPAMIEERLPTPEQSSRIFLTGKAPWKDAEGKTIGVVGIAQDISKRKAIEEERDQLLQELRRSNDDLAQFSYVVSHDLQSPLRMIRSYTELLAQRYSGELDGTAAEFISFVLEGAHSMEQLIQALLRYAQAGEEAVTRAPVRIDAVIDGALLNLQPAILERGAQLIRDPLPLVWGDPLQLLQLFQNLIGNAIKYARPGIPPQITIAVESVSGTEYRFDVSDNGIGIESKNFERIFAPLKRLHGQEIPGVGIGLALCKKIVERHGGRIWVTSALGSGSTFHFTLPPVQERTDLE